jgi:crossover junction endodeoxyribonuclease RuvC
MRVLAIDPGFGRCGMAVIERTGHTDVLIYSNCIETESSDAFVQRLKVVTDACTLLITSFTPDCVVLEKLFFSANKKTAMRVSEVRGALLNTATSHGLPVFEYSPGEVKNATTGYGAADKKQIARMVHVLMKIEKKIEHDDEYDAIAVGLTHLAHARNHVKG